jgi:hypothetical protein
VIRRLTVLLTLAVAFVPTATALAQSPASPEQQVAACTKGFAPLRQDAELKGKLIKAASERHAPPQEACELIGSYALASAKMVNYVEANADECAIAASMVEQLKAGYRKTEELRSKVCAKAEQGGGLEGTPKVNDFGDPAFRRGAF